MPEKMPPTPEWPVQIGDKVVLSADIPESIKESLEPQIQADIEYTVVDVIPADEHGPTGLIIMDNNSPKEGIRQDERNSYLVSIRHLQPARKN